MITDKYIADNLTNTFKKGDKVKMVNCYEATFEEYKNKTWTCLTTSHKDRSGQDVVFLENFSGSFITKYLNLI